MTELNKNKDVPRKAGEVMSVPVEDDVHIFKGALVVANASGYAEPATDAAAKSFLGVAYEECDNTLLHHSQGGKSIRIMRTGIFRVAASSVDQDSIGGVLYVVDDATVDETTVHYVPAGICTGVEGTTVAWIDIREAVATLAIANFAVTTAKIAGEAVTADKLADDAVETDKIIDDAVTTAKILNANVTADKLAANAVTTAKILNEAVTAAKWANGAGVAALLAAALGASAAYTKASNGVIDLLAAGVGVNAVILVAIVTEAFADGDGGQTTFAIGDESTPNKFFATGIFTGATLGEVFISAGVTASAEKVRTTAVKATGTGTGAISVVVLGLPTA